MRKSDFQYSLPPELVAQFPVSPRSASRLMTLEGGSGRYRDLKFSDLPSLLRAGDLLVVNDTRVIPARLYGRKDSGGAVEILIERFHDVQHARAQLRASKPPKPGQKIHLEGNITVEVLERAGEFYVLGFSGAATGLSMLERIGHVPLPPYIDRPDEAADRDRYQTVYARHPGAVAAPTAGLHFDEAMLDRLKQAGVEIANVTLHVGAGTFQPVRVDDIRAHRLHAEFLNVPQETCDKINATIAAGQRVVAVGTTVVRALETAARDGRVMPYAGDTELFLYPGCRIRIVDALVTNFHLPESSLLMLVCAFGGTEHVLNAYRHAVAERYRFYSYGDAMFITKADPE